MNFNKIDIENWARKPYYEHFINNIRCTFSMTVNIDITDLLLELHTKDIKFYPTFLYMVTKVVNAHQEFRTCFDEQGNVGYWQSMMPCFTFFHNDDKTFSNLWIENCENFAAFYSCYLENMQKYGDVKDIVARKNVPPNTFPVSCIPWANFTSFNLNIFTDGMYLLPIITGGKYFEQEGRTLLPVSLQVHHAVCDGYHASVFMDELQEQATQCRQWLIIE